MTWTILIKISIVGNSIFTRSRSMNGIIILSYIGGIILFLYLTAKIFIFLTKKDHKPSNQLRLIALLLVADILSTIYFVHVLGLGWTAEANAMVRKFGNSIGHLNSLLINHLLLIAGLCLLHVIFKKRPHLLEAVYGLFILVFSLAVVGNLIFSTLIKISNGHN